MWRYGTQVYDVLETGPKYITIRYFTFDFHSPKSWTALCVRKSGKFDAREIRARMSLTNDRLSYYNSKSGVRKYKKLLQDGVTSWQQIHFWYIHIYL